MADWIDRLASEFADEPLSAEDVNRLLEASREVAHRVERKITPVSAFLLGAAVGRATAAGASRAEALTNALATMGSLLPDALPTEEG